MEWLFLEVKQQGTLLKVLRLYLLQLSTGIYKIMHQIHTKELWPQTVKLDELPSCLYDFIQRHLALNRLMPIEMGYHTAKSDVGETLPTSMEGTQSPQEQTQTSNFVVPIPKYFLGKDKTECPRCIKRSRRSTPPTSTQSL